MSVSLGPHVVALTYSHEEAMSITVSTISLGSEIPFGQAFEGQNRKTQFWARLETEIVDLFGVYSPAISVHFTVRREVREGKFSVWADNEGVFAEMMVLERDPRDFLTEWI